MFAAADQYALRDNVVLDNMRPMKNRFLRIESIQGKRLLFIRTPNLIDAPVLEIDLDTETLLMHCTGRYTVEELQNSVCAKFSLHERLLTLYKYGAIIFDD